MWDETAPAQWFGEAVWKPGESLYGGGTEARRALVDIRRLDKLAARGQQASGFGDVDVRDE